MIVISLLLAVLILTPITFAQQVSEWAEPNEIYTSTIAEKENDPNKHQQSVLAVAFSLDGKTIASVDSNDKVVHLRSLTPPPQLNETSTVMVMSMFRFRISRQAFGKTE